MSLPPLPPSRLYFVFTRIASRPFSPSLRPRNPAYAIHLPNRQIRLPHQHSPHAQPPKHKLLDVLMVRALHRTPLPDPLPRRDTLPMAFIRRRRPTHPLNRGPRATTSPAKQWAQYQTLPHTRGLLGRKHRDGRGRARVFLRCGLVLRA